MWIVSVETHFPDFVHFGIRFRNIESVVIIVCFSASTGMTFVIVLRT